MIFVYMYTCMHVCNDLHFSFHMFLAFIFSGKLLQYICGKIFVASDYVLPRNICGKIFSGSEYLLPRIICGKIFVGSEYLCTGGRWGLHYLGQFCPTLGGRIPIWQSNLFHCCICVSVCFTSIYHQGGKALKTENCKTRRRVETGTTDVKF